MIGHRNGKLSNFYYEELQKKKRAESIELTKDFLKNFQRMLSTGLCQNNFQKLWIVQFPIPLRRWIIVKAILEQKIELERLLKF